MLGAAQLGSFQLGQGAEVVSQGTLFVDGVFIATLVNTTAALTVESTNPDRTLTSTNPTRTLEFTG